MKSDLIVFEKGIKDLTANIESLQIENNLIKTKIYDHQNDPVSQLLKKYKKSNYHNPTLRRRFNYNSIIVSLYGYLEQYIEALVNSYVSMLNDCTDNIEFLPRSIIKNHLRLSVELISKIQQNNYSGYLKSDDVIKNLYSCIEKINYKLNSEAFTIHSANFRKNNIDDFFSTIGISNITSLVKEEFLFRRQFINDFDSAVPENVSDDVAYFWLDDLANRRNQVSHGINSDILEYDTLQEYVSYTYFFGVCLFRVAYQQFISNFVKIRGVNLGLPTNVYRSGRVICVYLQGMKIDKDCKIIAHNNNSTVICNILNLKVDDDDRDEVDAKEKIEIGILLDKKVGSNHKIKIFNEKIP